MKSTLYSLMLLPAVAMTSLASLARAEQIFSNTFTMEIDGSPQDFDVTGVLKDGGNAAAITINGVELTFPHVGDYRCGGCLGIFADSFDINKQTIRFSFWSGNGDNTIDFEKFDYNPFLIMPAIFTTSTGDDVSLNVFASLDKNKALLSVDGSTYILDKISGARCPDCLGQFADVTDMEFIDSAKIVLTLFNDLAIKGAHSEINTFNFDKLFNNSVTYAGQTEEGYNGLKAFGYLSNDGESVLINLGFAASYVLNKIDQPRCLGCRGFFADVASINELPKADIALTLWDKFDAVPPEETHTIKFSKFEKVFPSPFNAW